MTSACSKSPSPRPAGTLGGQSLPTARSQRTPPPVRRHPGHPEPPGHLPVTGPGLDQISDFEPHLLTPSPLLSRQPTAIGIPHLPGIAHPTGAVTTRRKYRSVLDHMESCALSPAESRDFIHSLIRDT